MGSTVRDFSNIPDFDSLPPVEGMPQGCAWGVFDDPDSKTKDHLGCLNLLTPSVVQAALKEARDGISVSLNWPIGAIQTPGFARKGLVHTVHSFHDNPIEAFRLCGNDDEIEFNTQCSSQWDSLVHFAHQPSETNYNGTKGTKENLTQEFGAWDVNKQLPTLNHWHARGGIVARGVLVDYRAYADAHGIEFDPYDASQITVQDLEQVLKWEGVETRQGDVLIVRTGFTEGLSNVSAAEQARKLGTHRHCGVLGSVETARWFWNRHFAAVASDSIAFEQIPPILEDGTEGTIKSLGELWDLSTLSQICVAKKRYSFLLTSVPLNVPGSVGSPPNALAIF